MIHFSNVKEYAVSHLWIMPAGFLLGAIVLSRVMLIMDRSAGLPSSRWYLFPAGSDGARDLLSTIAASTFTFTGLVFSITIVVLQLASSQLSPRVMRLFLRDLGTQLVLAWFLGLFTYTLLILREVEGEPDEFVPSLSIWIAVALMLVALALFVYYINHITQRVRPVNIIHEIASESFGTISRVYPDAFTPSAQITKEPPGNYWTVRSDGRSGVVTWIATEALHNTAEQKGLIVSVVPALGDFVPKRGELARVWGREFDPNETDLAENFTLSRERTQQQDVGFGLRQLVDIAERALSPGINDPTTATQALDQIHSLLRELCTRAIPSEEHLTDPLVLMHETTWEDYVRLGLDEIRRYGSSSMQVLRRMRFLILDLLDLAPPERHDILLQQLALLDDVVSRNFSNEVERDLVRTPSAQSHGPTIQAQSRSL